MARITAPASYCTYPPCIIRGFLYTPAIPINRAMKLTIAKEQILLGLQAVTNVVGSRTPLPILSNLLLNASGEQLGLTATDLDVTISCAVPASVRAPGAITLPVKKLYGICRELSNLELDLET